MTDEALRTAEREARARPDDRAAAWTFVRALERAGKGPDARRALWAELCRLARAGDETADDTLERWSSSGSPEPLVSEIDLSRARTTVIARSHRALAVPVVLTRMHALCVSGPAIVAYDVVERREAWAHPGHECLPAMAGDDLVHVGGEGLVVRDVSTGVERQRVSVGGSCLRVIRGDAVLVADRAHRPSMVIPMMGPLGGPSHESARCLDLLAPATVRWTTMLERDTVSIVATRHGLVREVSGEGRVTHEVSPSWDLHLIDLTSGAFSDLRATTPTDSPLHAQDLLSPDGGCLLYRASHGDQGATRVGEFDLPSGRQRWRFDAPWQSRDLWGGSDLTLVRRRETGPGALVAIDRATGRPRWEVRPGPIEALTFIGEQIVLAAVTDPGVLVLTALSVADGRVVADRSVPLGSPISARRDGRARLVVANDGLRAAVAGRDSLVVVEVPA